MYIYIYIYTHTHTHTQSDYEVSVHLMMFCNRQVNRDFLINLYIFIYLFKTIFAVVRGCYVMHENDVTIFRF
jgi:hypothetical protein